MMTTRFTFFPLTALAFLLAGCGGVEIPIGDEGQSITMEDGGETTTFTDEESGLSITSGDGVEVSELFPSDFPLPEGAKVLSSGENEGFVLLLLEWEGMTKESFLAYVEQAKAAGYSESTEIIDLDVGGGAFNTAYTLSNGTYEVMVAGLGEPGSPGQLSLTSGPVSQ